MRLGDLFLEFGVPFFVISFCLKCLKSGEGIYVGRYTHELMVMTLPWSDMVEYVRGVVVDGRVVRCRVGKVLEKRIADDRGRDVNETTGRRDTGRKEARRRERREATETTYRKSENEGQRHDVLPAD